MLSRETPLPLSPHAVYFSDYIFPELFIAYR